PRDWFHPSGSLLIEAPMGKMKQTTRSELLPGTLDMLILKTLSRDVMHGYGIAKHIQQMSDDVLQIEEGSLYPALQRMELKGWIGSEWSQSPANRRARYYRLTAKGRKQLFQEVSSFDRFLAAISRVMRPA
ncbi:MAG: PadR family transcriptional regulator, partial [Bryobacteraceae bacterium]